MLRKLVPRILHARPFHHQLLIVLAIFLSLFVFLPLDVLPQLRLESFQCSPSSCFSIFKIVIYIALTYLVFAITISKLGGGRLVHFFRKLTSIFARSSLSMGIIVFFIGTICIAVSTLSERLPTSLKFMQSCDMLICGVLNGGLLALVGIYFGGFDDSSNALTPWPSNFLWPIVRLKSGLIFCLGLAAAFAGFFGMVTQHLGKAWGPQVYGDAAILGGMLYFIFGFLLIFTSWRQN